MQASQRLRLLSGHTLCLFRRICYAVTIAVLVWLFYSRGGPLRVIAMVLDFPVALASLVLNEARLVTGIDLFFGRGVGEFMSSDQVLLWHMRATVLVYVPLFYLAAALGGWLARARE